MHVAVGLAGLPGSGKGTFVKILKEVAEAENRRVAHIKSGDILKERLEEQGLPLTRANLQKEAEEMEKTEGGGALSKAVRERMYEASKSHDIIIFDGVRWPADIEVVRSFYQNFVVYIFCDSYVRYQRVKARKEKTGEENLTFEQFLAEEKNSTETFIPAIRWMAHVKIDNSFNREDLRRVALKFYETYLKNITAVR